MCHVIVVMLLRGGPTAVTRPKRSKRDVMTIDIETAAMQVRLGKAQAEDERTVGTRRPVYGLFSYTILN